jgi:hypothetical protein
MAITTFKKERVMDHEEHVPEVHVPELPTPIQEHAAAPIVPASPATQVAVPKGTVQCNVCGHPGATVHEWAQEMALKKLAAGSARSTHRQVNRVTPVDQTVTVCAACWDKFYTPH